MAAVYAAALDLAKGRTAQRLGCSEALTGARYAAPARAPRCLHSEGTYSDCPTLEIAARRLFPRSALEAF